MKMPNSTRAFVDIRKLRDYCLNLQHPRGKHKARVFNSVLGLTAEEAEMLRDALLHAANTQDTIPGEQDEYGQRYTLDFVMDGPSGQATIRSGWIVRQDEDFPRLLSCYVQRE